MNSIDFGLVLNLHQPAGNLDDLLDGREWEGKEILWALDRIPRSLWHTRSWKRGSASPIYGSEERADKI